MSDSSNKKTPKTQPKIKVDWHYSIKVTDRAGHLIRATVTAQIVDTFGGVHAVQYDGTTKNIDDVAQFAHFVIYARS